MFPPSVSALLSPSTKFDHGGVVSALDPFDDTLATRDSGYALAASTAVKVALGAGDVLVVPAASYHYAEATSLSVSLSGRAYTGWECGCFAPTLASIAAHHLGLYSVGDCTCHDTAADDGG